MTAQYDAIADAYRRTKQSPLRQYVETPSFLRRLGDLRGLRVLDLACGDGFYTRAIRRAGAAEVTGVDVSAGMIARAREAEAAEPLGIDYRCADAARLDLPGRFDVVAAAYLLHYAQSPDALAAMCRGIAERLVPGGRFVAINENPEQPPDAYAGYAAYGFDKRFAKPRGEGSLIEYTMLGGRELIRFEAHYYSRACYERALREAGFATVEWWPLEITEDPPAELPRDYFAAWLANPPAVGLECRL